MFPLPEVTADAMVPEKAQALSKFFIVRCDHPAFSAGNLFDGVKAEYRHICQGTGFASFIFCAKCLTTVCKQRQVVFVGKVSELIPVTGLTCIVNPDDNLCVFCNFFFNFQRINEQCIGFHICKYRGSALKTDTVGC